MHRPPGQANGLHSLHMVSKHSFNPRGKRAVPTISSSRKKAVSMASSTKILLVFERPILCFGLVIFVRGVQHSFSVTVDSPKLRLSVDGFPEPLRRAFWGFCIVSRGVCEGVRVWWEAIDEIMAVADLVPTSALRPCACVLPKRNFISIKTLFQYLNNLCKFIDCLLQQAFFVYLS